MRIIAIASTMETPSLSAFEKSLRSFSWVFLLITLAELGSHFVQSQLPTLHYITKSLITLSLLFFYIRQTRHPQKSLGYWVPAALICSLLGDVLLMFQGDLFFIAGLSAFLLAHLCYIRVFMLHGQGGDQREILRRKPWLTLFFVAYSGGLLFILYPNLGSMFVPVAIYALVIMIMALSTLNRWKRVPDDSFTWVFLGALLFMLSDSLIAINKFSWEIPLSSIWIMATYMAAQYLIVAGVLRQVKAPRRQVAALN